MPELITEIAIPDIFPKLNMGKLEEHKWVAEQKKNSSILSDRIDIID